MPDLDQLVRFFETISPASEGEFARFYAPEAYFKDPFNEVRGVAAIRRVFEHMFEQVDAPRFRITDRIVSEAGAMLVWEFGFRLRRWRPDRERLVRGVSHLRFDAQGRVSYHRDYWDTAEELYAKLPLLGPLMRALQRGLRAP